MRFLILFFFPLIYSPVQWETFTNMEGRFSIKAPGHFEEKMDTISTAIGELVYHTFYYQNVNPEKSENEVYMVNYCDYPEGIVFTDSIGLAEDFFQTTIEAAVASVKGELLYATDIRLNEYPGKFWRIDYPHGKGTIKTKAYLVNNRYYAVQFISFDINKMNESADRFFDSFKLL